MNCDNCGAPMLLVRDRDYYFCEYCGAFHFPQPTEEGVRALQDNLEGLECPVCSQRLAQASLDDLPALYCRGCRGVLMMQGVFGQLVQQRRAKARGSGKPPRPLNLRELERRLRCPRCKNLMGTHPYLGPGNIVIDNCTSCLLVWLDPGELTAIEGAPGRDRGDSLRVEWSDDRRAESWLHKSLRLQGKL
jgi:Zn-finger nucleic acid-binding protein